MSHLKLAFGTAFLLGFFSAFSFAQDVTLDGLKPVAFESETFSNGEIPGYNQNCMVHELSAPGQGLHASGATAGLTFLPPGMSVNPSMSLDFPDFDVEPMNATAVILVVDEFTNHLISHGALVMSHINALIRETGKFSVTSSSADGDVVEWVRGNGDMKKIIVRAVDVNGNSVPAVEKTVTLVNGDDIAAAITNAISTANESFGDDVRIVVNMSFVLLPCPVLADFVASDIKTFYDYTQALVEANKSPTTDGPTLYAIEQAIKIPFSDNLTSFLIESPTDVTFVASSGNFGFDFQMYPAEWPSVFGVSASQYSATMLDSATMLANFSNIGEVIATGAWFSFGGLCQNSDLCTAPEDLTGQQGTLAYAGTSFSAPAVSVATAFYVQCDPPSSSPSTGFNVSLSYFLTTTCHQ